MSDMLTEALNYASRGWYVFPCREKPGATFHRNGEDITPQEKTPYTPQGLNDASIDFDQIKAWWNRFPNALIGVNAGKSGLFVVDIDRKHVNGLETFQSWNINDSAGLHSITPSGGMHIVFTGTGKSSTNGKIGIDSRGEGGYFIAPPSCILEGDYTGEYKYFDDWGRTPGIIPDGLLSKLFPDRTVEYVKGITEGGKKQLSRNSLLFLANGAPLGERNSTLFKVLADFAGCGYTEQEAKDTVSPSALRTGLTMGEFETVLSHAYSKERTASIPDTIQEKIMAGGKDLASKITFEEQGIMEMVLLSCLLVDNTLIPIIHDILAFEDFQVLKNRIIYRAIIRMHNSGMKVDYVTVAGEVTKETDKISFDDISKMVNQYFSNTDMAQTYAFIIKEKASIRKIEALMDNKDKYLKHGSVVEIVSALEKDIADIAVYGGIKTTSVMTANQAGEQVEEKIRKICSGEIQQLKIGIADYDKYIGGLYSNEMVVCAARAGEGKSALALSILNDVALKQNKPCVLFSLEMSTHETISRLVCQLTGIPFRDVYQGKISGEERTRYVEAMDKIKSSKLFFDETFGITVPELRSKIRKLVEKDIELIVIDQLEQIKGYEGQPAYIQFDRIAYDIKNLTQEFNVPIILNHQLNRNITNRQFKNPEPILSDLNQAGEKPANQVWVINHDKDEHGEIIQSKLKILKNRNGATMTIPILFVQHRMLFASPTYSNEALLHEESGHVIYEYDTDDSDDSGEEPGWINR